MRGNSTAGRERGRASTRLLAVVAAVLWATAALLAAGFFLTQSEAGPSSSTAWDAAAGDAAEQVTTVPPTTLATSPPSATSSSTTAASTTTTLPPPLTVAAGGDVLGDRGVGNYIDKHGGPAVFAKVKPFLASADLSIVNLECPISTLGSPRPGKEYTFEGRPALIEGLVSAGIDVVSLANNHVLDYGQAALKDTFQRLEEAGVGYAGAGLNAQAAAAPALVTTPAGTVAVLACTEIIPWGFAATASQAGTNAITEDRKKLLADIEAAAQQADFVVVSVHWGEEYTATAGTAQRQLAHRMIDAGADLVLGHHPHVIQGLEIYKDKLIAYSLGDFVFDHYSRETGEAFVLQVSIPRTGQPSLTVIPVYLNDDTGVPAPVTGSEAATILKRLAKISNALGLELAIQSDRAYWPTAPPLPPTALATSTS